MPRRMMNALLIVLVLGATASARAQTEPSRIVYRPTWESLDKHETPEWMMDAKVGLFVYPLHPTEEQFGAYKKRTGRLGKYRALDGWDKTTWDPQRFAKLARDAGAKYVVFGVDPYSYFLSWPSQYADVDGSPFVHVHGKGSKKDYVGEMAQAVRKQGLRFGIYRNYLHPVKNPYFLETTYELIDRYEPSTLWLDGEKMNYRAEEARSRELAAYYYNHSKMQNEVALEDALGAYKRASWGKWQDHGDWFRKEMSPPHKDITNGYFVRYETLYRWGNRSPVGESAGFTNNLVEWLIDSVSKNGNIELTIHLGPESLYRHQERALLQIGQWLDVNRDAIYGSRPWAEGKPESRSPEGIHVRYTTKGDSLYAFLFRWPERGITLPRLQTAPGTTVRMLGIDFDSKFEQRDGGLYVMNPPGGGGEGFQTEIPCDHAYCLKITPRPRWTRDIVSFAELVSNTQLERGKVIAIEGPPHTIRDRDKEMNSVESSEPIIGPRRAIPDGVYASLQKNWLSVQHPGVDLKTIAELVSKRYTKLILDKVHAPELTGLDVEHLTLVYPASYDGNTAPVEVPVRRLTIHADDRFGDRRSVVAYFANYHNVNREHPHVVFQVNGHFGQNPSRQGFGLENRGGYSGAALGKLAMGGLPLITFDDHDVGESSPATGNENGLYRTLANLHMLDDALLVHFENVDVVGLSGGCERLYHFLMFHRSKIRSAYLAGMYVSPWTRLDSRDRTGGPFGINGDTNNVLFDGNFQWSDFALVGIANGIRVAFAQATGEGGTSKNCFATEMLPAIKQYTDDFDIRGDDPDGDGVSNNGRNLAHEYDLIDVREFLHESMTGGKGESPSR